jgi:hypothetical protein
MTQSELNARASIGVDLFVEGRIRRTELFRLEVDALLGHDSGDLKFESNKDFEFLVGEGILEYVDGEIRSRTRPKK